MKPIAICFTYFKSLTLANLRASLYSVRRQGLSLVEEIIVVDNDTDDSERSIQETIDMLSFPVPVRLLSFKHGDASKTHSWSVNAAVRASNASTVLFARADYLLDFTLIEKFAAERYADLRYDAFVTSSMRHLDVDVFGCERTAWREHPDVLQYQPGVQADYTHIDSGVWMTSREAFDNVGGFDEALSAWGHSQTHFQYKLHQVGVKFVRIPEVLFYHPLHAAPRDMAVANQQLRDIGYDIHDLWTRYEGANPY